MPISTFFGLQTSLRGLLAQQRAMDTTGHNIANANTAGYSRQEAVMTAADPLLVAAGAVQSGAGADLGAGVDIQAYRRLRDTFLDLQYRSQATVLGEKAETARSLDRAELALAEPSDNGIGALLGKFWSGWADLANAPENPAARQALVDQASTLVEAFHTLDDQLATVGQQAMDEFNALTATGTGDVAGIATGVAALNRAITAALQSGTTPNALLDRRDALLDKLAGLGRVTITDTDPVNQPGMVDVQLGDPPATAPVVAGGAAAWAGPPASPGGKLGALLAVGGTGGTIDSYRADLAAVAKTLADAVNAVHGTPPFFTFTGTTASLAVNVDATTVRPGSTTAPGANDIARAAAQLRGSGTDAAYSAFVTRVGGDLKAANREEANAQALSDAVDDRRQSVAGVSMDEEMTNLVRFQRGYQASARAMTTMDELLDTLINRTGRVGL